MPFTDAQIKTLSAKLNAKHVKSRRADSVTLSYIEGWHAVAEANRIFGFDGWDRKSVISSCIWQGQVNGRPACSYVARVAVTVRAEGSVVVREGSGAGHGAAETIGEAHEKAIKIAETDATKRALSTFGNPFGLALYDKEQRAIRGKPKELNRSVPFPMQVKWLFVSATGDTLDKYADPVAYCAAMRKELKKLKNPDKLIAFWKKNQDTVADLRRYVPDLKTEKGQHYAEILGKLFTERLRALAKERASAAIAEPPKTEVPDDTDPSIKPRRIRDKDHLKFVATQPCLICGRAPCQAHHVTYAQLNALGRKVSDEWAVPLCAIHHRSLHDNGNERAWWKGFNIDPIKEAEELWKQRSCRSTSVSVLDSL